MWNVDDKKAQDAMTQALVDVNKKMVTQLKKPKKDVLPAISPHLYNVTRLTPLSRGTLVSAGNSVTAEGWWYQNYYYPDIENPFWVLVPYYMYIYEDKSVISYASLGGQIFIVISLWNLLHNVFMQVPLY